MSNCGACGGVIAQDAAACDGVCGRQFHAACLKRGTRSSCSSTCIECLEIKPCHVLRLVKGITETFSSDLALVADKVNSFFTRWVDLQAVSDDMGALSAKVDRLLGVVGSLESNSDALLERSHELSSRMLAVSGSLDDVQAALAGLDSGLVPSMNSAPILPMVDDIRRGVRQVKGDLSSWSAAVSANSDLLISIASDVKALSERCAISSVPPSSFASRVVDRSAAPSPTAPEGSIALSGGGMGGCPSLSPVDGMVGPGLARGVSAQRSRAARGRGRRRRAPVESSASVLPSDGDPSHAVESAPSASVGLSDPSAHPAAVILRPAKRPKCVFISRIHPDTPEGDIANHISSCVGVPLSMISCRRISPVQGRDGRTFTASFKAFVPEDVFPAVVSPDIWPPGSIVREFIPRARAGSSSNSKNSSTNCPSVMPT